MAENDFSLKETCPKIGGGRSIPGHHSTSWSECHFSTSDSSKLELYLLTTHLSRPTKKRLLVSVSSKSLRFRRGSPGPDSPLAPQWYRLEDINRNKFGGEVMLSVWMGTQADEVFPEAWHSDSVKVSRDNASLILSLEDKLGQKEECLGKCEIKLSQVETRVLPGPVLPIWYNLVGDSRGFAGRLHLRVSLDGGYHVLDESTQV
ncbi:hypothetical protein IGI04_011936 [Brassica rapa subsp. trilocularis]|uniref:C2 domain-containing protein n=1 Tax=Brassica rapa subsp. trilocularis TaxID=1813537 RepID=A0ABQ7N4K5_BRACM|nr:hypothetical protein IGI04_011936 [Brassica rapa subsp. trilocularis]